MRALLICLCHALLLQGAEGAAAAADCAHRAEAPRSILQHDAQRSSWCQVVSARACACGVLGGMLLVALHGMLECGCGLLAACEHRQASCSARRVAAGVLD